MQRYVRIQVRRLEGCRRCAEGLEALLRSVPGVADAVVDADTGSVYAHFDSDRLTESGLRTAMRRGGYPPGPSLAY